MSDGREESILRVAEAVSDGTPVDWQREKTHAPALQASLEHLAVLERIRDLHRQPPGAPASVLDDDTRSAGARTGLTQEPLFTWGHLRVLEQVGEGGWAIVYRAFDPALEVEVALKMLKEKVAEDASAVERFISEARRLARVRHENVLIVHGADRQGDRVGMWTEFLRGQSLEEYLLRQGPLSAREATLIGLDLCRALSAVHAAGLVHRDVKASNVMRADGGRIVLMDFGSVAEVVPGASPDSTRSIHGTPVTMAPEQLRGKVAGAATDVYGLGALLYYLVSGRYPVEARTLPELVQCHDERRYVPLRDRRSDISLRFVQVVERAIAPSPEARYPSAGAMEQALNSTLVPERPPWVQYLAEHRGLVAAAAVLVAAVIGLGVWRPEPVPKPPDGGSVARVVPAQEALSAVATLQRRVGSREEPVTSGGRIVPGDRLSLQLRAAVPMHVYVLNEDRKGEMFVLFPIPGVEPENPIQPNQVVRLPGTVADSLVYWNVTSAGGRESVIAIGAREPIRELDSLFAYLPRAEAGRPVQSRPGASGRTSSLRGIGGLETVPETRRDAARRRVEEMLPALEDRRARRGDVWIWRTEVQNPVPGS